jgi:hypothetical protein
MELIGATVFYGNQCFAFREACKIMSMLDGPVTFEYAGVQETIKPHAVVLATREFVEWALNDRSSPFKNGGLAHTSNDEVLSVDVATKIAAPVTTPDNLSVKLPDGEPDATWKPSQLMKLYSEMGKPIQSSVFLPSSPASKARRLCEAMKKGGFSIKDGKLVKELAS